MAAGTEKCRNLVLRNVFVKTAMKARREFDARVGALPRRKTVHRPFVKRLWINRKASEDREGWVEEAKAHSERCYDDKDETSQMQEERIQEQRQSGDCLEWTGRKVDITVDRVLRARGKMKKAPRNLCTTSLIVLRRRF